MTRFQLALVLVLVVGLAGWMTLRSGKTAGAAEAQPVAAYGENTEEVAQHRWQTNAPRHWRALMVKR